MEPPADQPSNILELFPLRGLQAIVCASQRERIISTKGNVKYRQFQKRLPSPNTSLASGACVVSEPLSYILPATPQQLTHASTTVAKTITFLFFPESYR
ncbi:hypothetical protein MKZ38_001704 [Zalerion maritima]|uniref:Uncharacterized protein n=1 Tax=Zalerion maritima TaxID=339359 RepID=A0AAD5WMJ3_9PEZI|nr:hypothetical protein MKZ38_001704 [Zalerion maritima]